MSEADLKLVRESVAALLAAHNEDAVFGALERDGWLEVLPGADGTWPMVDTAAATLAVIASENRAVPLAPHLAATTLLAEVGAEPPSGPLAIGADLHHDPEGELRARFWGGDGSPLVVDDEDSVLVIPAGAIEFEPDLLLDPTGVRWAHFDPSMAARSEIGSATRAKHRARLAYLLAVEAIAAVGHANELTFAYLKDRRQFGSTLASFQVLQHRAVEMFTAHLLGSGLVTEATAAWRDGGGDTALASSWGAKSIAGTRGVWAVENAIQLHGGIGFTWELGLHFALRRGQRARLFLGGPEEAGREVLGARSEDRGPRPIDWAQRRR